MVSESSAIEFSEGPGSSLELTRQIRRRDEINARRDKGGRFWEIYGSHLKDYEDTFMENLGGLKLKDFLGSRMSPVVIDLMAPSDTLAKLFSKSSSDSLLGKVPFLKNKDDENEERKRKPSLGLAIALEDRRTKKQVQRDNNLNLS